MDSHWILGLELLGGFGLDCRIMDDIRGGFWVDTGWIVNGFCLDYHWILGLQLLGGFGLDSAWILTGF